MRCGQVHSQARQFVAAGQPTHLVAETLEISRSSLYYRPQPRSSRADRRHDQRIVEVCGDKPAFGYRRVQWWLQDVGGLRVNRKRVLRVMREAACSSAADVSRSRAEKTGAPSKHRIPISSGSPT